VLIGSLAVVFGLGFWTAVLTCVTANIAGALMNSAAVAMGPKLGMPQMPMSRAAFGYVGNYLPAFLASTLFVGYFATTNIVGAETVQQIWHQAPYTPVAIVLGIAAIGLTIYGYNLVHSIERYMSLALGIIFLVLTIIAFVHGFGPSHTTTVHGKAFWEPVALEFMIIFSFTASWAPYASDFSRYLPANTPSRKPFGWSFLGMVLGTSWMNIVGIYLGTLAAKNGILNRGAADYPDIAEFYKRNGAFGTIRWAGLLSFLIGVAVSVPFMATVLYTGPIGRALGGADISYGVSAAVAGAIYYVWAGRLKRSRQAAMVGSAVASSPAQ
jgi:NCS1 family nucleobase:cation symporter-1